MAEEDSIFNGTNRVQERMTSNGTGDQHSADDAGSAESVSMTNLLMLPFTEARARALEEFDRKFLSAALARHNGNIARTARSLGLHRQSLQKLMGRRGIKSIRTPATAAPAIPEPAEKE